MNSVVNFGVFKGVFKFGFKLGVGLACGFECWKAISNSVAILLGPKDKGEKAKK